MAVARDRREVCDGCGRSVPVAEMRTVTMHDGEQLASCPRCEPNLRDVARRLSTLDKRRRACDGCTKLLPWSELTAITLADDTVVECCSSCLQSLSDDTEAGTRNDTGTSSTTDETRMRSGTSTTSNTGTNTNGGTNTDTGTNTNTFNHTQPAGSSDSKLGSDTGDSDSERVVCSQCHEWIRAERFHVTTVDGRKERTCADCLEQLEESGVVATVRMRKSEARSILGVTADATDREIRAAYLEQIKSAHPDRQTGSRSAFLLVTEAYDRLK